MRAQSTEEPVGFALIGYGDHSEQSHGPYVNSAHSSLIGVADLDPTRLDAARSTFDLPDNSFTSDYRELLGNQTVDAVIITTGDSSHYPIAREAIAAGKHVFVEKPAAATKEQLQQLPALLDEADAHGLRLWVCHPREFGDGPWRTAAEYIHNPHLIEERFRTRAIGALTRLQYDCLYTLPEQKHEEHTSFADDKLNHNIVSVLQALPEVTAFHDARLLHNGPLSYAAYLEADDPATGNTIQILSNGQRTANKYRHGGGVYRDWLTAVFEEATLQVEPSLGTIALTYGKRQLPPVQFDTSRLYENMFTAITHQFTASILDRYHPEPLTRQAKLLGTAAAILMQQPGFTGEISETAIDALSEQ